MRLRSKLRSLRSAFHRLSSRRNWSGSADYWERRYSEGGNSGAGSYGANAKYKADIVNRWVREQAIETVIELGSGDGNQLRYANYVTYLGLDVSRTAIQQCIEKFASDATKSFCYYESALFVDKARWLHADAAVSLEVIFHLVEEDVFTAYMTRLFQVAEKIVIICSSNREDLPAALHERHRCFTDWVTENQPQWELAEHIVGAKGMVSEFFRFARRAESVG